MTRIMFDVTWAGEKDAGIRAGSEEVTIQFRYGQPVDAALIEYWRTAISEFFDGASVELNESGW